MKKTFFLILLSTMSCQQNPDLVLQKSKINGVLDQWHLAAAQANFDKYFGLMTDDAVFIGTDATENWQNQDFKKFAKPYFDKGKAWSFKSIERHIYFSADGKLAWFDELLDTQMKICRGSGILKMENNNWKIAHYVLSMTIPNQNVDAVLQIKSPLEDLILKAKK